MIRVVADANVLVSAALTRSPLAPSAVVLDAALDGRIELLSSPILLTEIASVLERPRLRRYLSLDTRPAGRRADTSRAHRAPCAPA